MPEKDSKIDVTKVVEVNEAFQNNREFLARLGKNGVLSLGLGDHL